MNGSQSATRVRPKSVSFSLLHLVSTGVAQGSPVMLNIPSHCSRWLATESLAGLLVVAGGRGVAFVPLHVNLFAGFLGFHHSPDTEYQKGLFQETQEETARLFMSWPHKSE